MWTCVPEGDWHRFIEFIYLLLSLDIMPLHTSKRQNRYAIGLINYTNSSIERLSITKTDIVPKHGVRDSMDRGKGVRILSFKGKLCDR